MHSDVMFRGSLATGARSCAAFVRERETGRLAQGGNPELYRNDLLLFLNRLWASLLSCSEARCGTNDSDSELRDAIAGIATRLTSAIETAGSWVDLRIAVTSAATTATDSLGARRDRGITEVHDTHARRAAISLLASIFSAVHGGGFADEVPEIGTVCEALRAGLAQWRQQLKL